MKKNDVDLSGMTDTEVCYFGHVIGCHDSMAATGEGYDGHFPRSAVELRERLLIDEELGEVLETIESRLLVGPAFRRIHTDYHTEVFRSAGGDPSDPDATIDVLEVDAMTDEVEAAAPALLEQIEGTDAAPEAPQSEPN